MTGLSNRRTIEYVCLINDKVEKLEADKKWKWPSVVIIFWITSFLLGGIVYLVDFFELKSIISYKKLTELTEFSNLPQINDSLIGYLIRTPGCRIPEMGPFDPSVKEYIVKPEKIICNKGIPPLFETNFTSLFMIPEYISFFNITNTSDLRCCYKKFWRQNPPKNKPDNQVSYENKCIYFNVSNTVQIDDEFIKVMCKERNKTLYEDYFAFVPRKNKARVNTKINNSKPNILVLGLDAVSRVNLHRQLPKTLNYLTKELGAFEFLGYNKVADNTFVNLIPVLTGMFEKELQKSCWNSYNSYFDNCSFLWSYYSQNNYLTALGEDCAWMGIFNYNKKGFIKQPTDYFYNTFNREMEAKIGSKFDFNCNHCVGGRENYKVTLEYIKKFIIRMKLESKPYFGFFWISSLSHDYLNRPALGDQSFFDLLGSFKKFGVLKNTILIFMSDHGIRWGNIRRTYQGQMEERLPFIFMKFPKWFKESYPVAVMNLKKNTRRLTTPFDLHETLKQLVHPNNLKNARKIYNETISRGYSLFNEIPAERTCEDAQIASHWCTCQKSIDVMANDTQVVNAAKFAVNNMNSQLIGYAQCATLALDSIINARLMYYDSQHISNEKSIKDYTIILKTIPGEGVFEVTVRYKENEHHLLTTNNTKKPFSEEQWTNFTITGTVSRLNLYGKQSYCITDFHLKLYCYCKSLLKI